jgi:hypothetical protein
MENSIFYSAVALWSFVASYWIVFKIMPALGGKGAHEHHAPAPVIKHPADHARPQHSAHDGFRAYAKDGELTVDDIVKALSRE